MKRALLIVVVMAAQVPHSGDYQMPLTLVLSPR